MARSRGTGSLTRRTAGGPWIARYWDNSGRRREHSTRTTDKQAAERIMRKLMADDALRREGVIDPRDERYAVEGRRPLTEHVAAYLAHCEHAGMAPAVLAGKRFTLAALMRGANVTRLAELDADALVRHLSCLTDRGLAPATVNIARKHAVAFFSWCVKTGRADSNPLKVVPLKSERADRRRVRRALTDEELARLLRVARERGREAWYLAALWAGLRKGDLRRLTWGDVDLHAATLTVRLGKAKRTDVLALHPELTASLLRLQEGRRPFPAELVWPHVVTDRTRQKDFQRAGIALRDEEGRVVDLHALRTALGTKLARAGVAPQKAMQMMRHGDYRTTLAHYTRLELSDMDAVLQNLPAIMPAQEVIAATGTADSVGIRPHPKRHPNGCEMVRKRATGCSEGTRGVEQATNGNTQQKQGVSRDSSKESCERVKGLEPSTSTLARWQPGAEALAGARTCDEASRAPTPCPTSSPASGAPSPDVEVVFAAWPTLPLAVRIGIVALVTAAAGLPNAMRNSAESGTLT